MIAEIPINLKRILLTFSKYKYLLKEEGMKSCKYIFLDILSKMYRLIFSIEKYFLYRFTFDNLQESMLKYLPKINDLQIEVYKVPISMREFENLSETGYDFRKHPKAVKYDEKINGKGVFVFCGVVNNELAYHAVVSTDREGVYKSVYPKRLHSAGTVYQGLNVTMPKFRKKGLYIWGQTEMLKFFKKNNFSEMIMLEAERLEGMRRVQDRLGSEVLYLSYCIRILFFIDIRLNKYKKCEQI